MILERDGFTFVPIKTFARLAGVDVNTVNVYITNGVIHQSYVTQVYKHDREQGIIILVREDKAKPFKQFIDAHRKRREIIEIIYRKYNVKITEVEFLSMEELGFISEHWLVGTFVYGRKKFGEVRRFYKIKKIPRIVKAYYKYLSIGKDKFKLSCLGVYGDDGREPENTELYKPNENMMGFMLTPEQIKRLKVLMGYRTNREPLF